MLNPYALVIVAALVAALAVAGWRLDVVTDERDAAVGALETERANAKVVERVVTVEKEVIRRVPVIRRELVRLCVGEGPGAGVPDAAAGEAPGDVRAGRLQRLGAEVAICLQTSERLVGLQEAVRNAGCAE